MLKNLVAKAKAYLKERAKAIVIKELSDLQAKLDQSNVVERAEYQALEYIKLHVQAL